RLDRNRRPQRGERLPTDTGVARALRALGVLARAVGRDQALDALARAVALHTRSFAARDARALRGVGWRAIVADVFGARFPVDGNIGVVSRACDPTLSVALAHLAVARRLRGHGLAPWCVHRAADSGGACARVAFVVLPGTVGGRETADAHSHPVALE